MGLSVSGLSSSGIDVASLVSQLMTVEKAPQDALSTKKTAALTQGTAWASVNTQLTVLQSAVAAMSTPAALNSSTTSTSDSSVLSATASGSASASSISLRVTSLAAAEQSASAGFSATSSLVGTGSFLVAGGASAAGFSSITSAGIAGGRHSLTVTAGADTGGTATLTLDGTDYSVTVGGGPVTIGGLTLDTGASLKTGAAVDLTSITTDSTTTLAGLAAGMAAYGGPAAAAAIDVGSGTNPARLVLSASNSGTANALTISGTGELSALASGMSDIRSASDAVISMGSLTITRSSNTVTDLVPGVTLNLLKASPGEDVTLSVGRDPTSTGNKVKAVVDALNGVLDLLASSSAYDTATHTGQPLTGDSRVRLLSQSLSGMGSVFGSGSTVSMSQLGVSFTRDGRYTFDPAAFASQLTADPTGTATLASNAASSLTPVLSSALGALGTPGWVQTAIDGTNSDAANLQTQIDSWDVRLSDMETRYKAQYSALDVAINSLNSQKTWLTSTLAGLSTTY
jgi:flagellar hook-associated protein 2